MVLVILGIALVLVGVNFTTSERQHLQDASERIGLLLQYAADKARVSGRMLGWSATKSGYAFQVQDPDTRQWLALSDDDSLRPRQFDHDIRLVSASEDGVMLQSGQMVTFSASGSNAAVDIVLGLDDERAAIKIAPTGNYDISFASTASARP